MFRNAHPWLRLKRQLLTSEKKKLSLTYVAASGSSTVMYVRVTRGAQVTGVGVCSLRLTWISAVL